MVIQRKYLSFEEIFYYDPELEKEIIALQNLPDKTAKQLMKANALTIPAFAEMGCCISNMEKIMKLLEEKDSEEPFDNGLSFSDVTEIRYLPDLEGNIIHLLFISARADLPKQIVQVISLKNKNGHNNIVRDSRPGFYGFTLR